MTANQSQNDSQKLLNYNDYPPNIQTSGLRIGKCEDLSADTTSEWVSKVVALVFIFLFCLTLNSIVILLVYKTKKLHKDMCYLIVNMAFSDMLVMALGLEEWLNILFTESRSWKIGGYFGTISCKVVTLLRFVAPMVSITTLIVISMERLRAVLSPIRVQPIRRLLFWCLVGLSWLFPSAIYSYTLYAFDIITYEGDVYCYDVDLDRRGWIIYHFVFYAILILLFILLVSLNLTIIKKLHTSHIAVSLPENEKKKRMQKFVRAVAMVACCSVLFVVCWGPRNFLRFLDHLAVVRFDYCLSKNFFFVIDFLFYLNFSLSPIVYFVFLKDFSDAFRQITPWKN
ncbi:bombesin receptor subtype-3-like [Actinia tenebrosa]|uniref:Bombesin receptor subtype-3-like n=1 Tax=Actinia tenebrosa TaxID=6105 RepID=A0A6P8ISL8_ACTTE|nr:bombesin receptor subtype-3-like [Actinia tenebrosa]